MIDWGEKKKLVVFVKILTGQLKVLAVYLITAVCNCP
jgi:hypothetical protein